MNMKKTKSEKDANRYHINADDCDQAITYLKACRELKELDEDKKCDFFYDHQEGLLLAAMVSYGKTFTKSKGGDNSATLVSAKPKKVFENNIKMIELHNEIIIKRNKAVAHSDDEFYRTELTEIQGTETLREKTSVDFLGSINIDLFIEIAESMRNFFRSKAHDMDIGREDL